jgi:hypothetical protein
VGMVCSCVCVCVCVLIVIRVSVWRLGLPQKFATLPLLLPVPLDPSFCSPSLFLSFPPLLTFNDQGAPRPHPTHTLSDIFDIIFSLSARTVDSLVSTGARVGTLGYDSMMTAGKILRLYALQLCYLILFLFFSFYFLNLLFSLTNFHYFTSLLFPLLLCLSSNSSLSSPLPLLFLFTLPFPPLISLFYLFSLFSSLSLLSSSVSSHPSFLFSPLSPLHCLLLSLLFPLLSLPFSSSLFIAELMIRPPYYNINPTSCRTLLSQLCAPYSG